MKKEKVEFQEKFRKISDEVGRFVEDNNNSYKKAYELVTKYVDGDYDKLMQLKAECSLDSYDSIMAAAIKIMLGTITLLTFIWGIISKSQTNDILSNIVSIVYIMAVPFTVAIIASVHNRYKYVGKGEKYVKLAIENMIKEYHIKW